MPYISTPKILISGDHNVFNEGWNGCGVYMASGCYKSETFSQPIYIGSSKDIQDRIEKEHIYELNRNNHPHNSPFQIAWNNHGKNNFVWWLLELSDQENVLEVEQKYLDHYRPFVSEFRGFNISRTVSGRTGPHSEETKKKIGDSNRGKIRTLQQINNIKIGKRENIKSIPFKLKSPDGEIFEGSCVKSFCEEKEISMPNIKRVLAKEYLQYKGWALPETTIAKNKKYTVTLPSGEKIITYSLKQFALDRGWCPGTMYKLFNGRIKNYKKLKIE